MNPDEFPNESPKEPRRVQPLQYGRPVYGEPEPRVPMVGRMAIGGFGYIGLCVAWIALVINARLPTEAGWGGLVAITLALMWLSIFLRERYRFSGLGYGMLIAIGLIFIGVPLLLLGMCAMMN